MDVPRSQSPIVSPLHLPVSLLHVVSILPQLTGGRLSALLPSLIAMCVVGILRRPTNGLGLIVSLFPASVALDHALAAVPSTGLSSLVLMRWLALMAVLFFLESGHYRT